MYSDCSRRRADRRNEWEFLGDKGSVNAKPAANFSGVEQG